jgi:glycosyltransferase involved in cell wall biosynthesis
MPKLVRITTMPVSLKVLLKGQMRFMREKGFDVTMISSDGPEVNPLVAHEGCPHIPVKLTRKITPFTDLASLIKLTRLLRQIRPDIVHTHTPKAGLLGMWAAKLSGVPVRLHTIAGLPWVESRGWKRRLLKTMEKLTAYAATEILPNSFVQQQFLFDEGIARRKMKVIGGGSSNGIDSQYFSPHESILHQSQELLEQEPTPAAGWVWIFVGRIVKDKGIAELLDAFDLLHQQFPDDRLWMVGEEEPELDPLSEKHRYMLHEHKAIRWWGYQTDIRPYLAAAKVLVFPSYREGFPNVPLQAGAMGCMLLLSDINGCNEIVQDGENGMLVPPKDSKTLASSMFRIRTDDTKRVQFAAAIQKKIREQYNQQTLWNQILEKYEEEIKK